jgi:hypothetical protein
MIELHKLYPYLQLLCQKGHIRCRVRTGIRVGQKFQNRFQIATLPSGLKYTYRVADLDPH